MPNYKMTYRLITYLTISMLICACGQLPKHTELKEIATELNKQCPSMRDSGTRWDKAVALPANILELTFTFINIEKDNTDIIGLEKELRIFLIDHLKSGLKTDTADNIYMESLKNNKVTFKYIYLDNKGQLLTTLLIRPEEYKD